MNLEILKERQGWTLEQKIDHAVGTVEAFKARTGHPFYVSFSGGKDSTVLLDLVRRFIDPNQKAVFNNTGNEYPEIIKFVKSTSNVTIISPHTPIRSIIEKHGFPLISKEQAQYIREAKTTKSAKLLDIRLNGSPQSKERKVGKIPEKWKFLIYEPFMVSEKCCYILKKKPFRDYERETGELPILGTMAGESRIRQQAYIHRGGCNSFKENHESCNPLSIWTEQDIWDYIHRFNIRYCPLYDERGCNRTGCMFCGFGAHIEKESRFDLVFRLHPKMYQFVMNYTNSGVTYREALHKCGIRLPDDPKQLTLFDL
jgi:3'-phosphoadenosine 5'-phosphosulfate sulfotransferase (PAPS reductase)/FAD synthetase